MPKAERRLEVLTDFDSMFARYPLLKQLNATLTEERYAELLRAILKQGNYFQVACFEDEKCIAVSGVWIATQIWCGKFIEVDNFVVDEAYRGHGIGQLILEWIENKGREEGCEQIHLDSYVTSDRANQFYLARGFQKTGFHMTKKL